MKEGYLVINESTSGDGLEVFGCYRSLENAETKLKKVLKNRFPGKTQEEIEEECMHTGDSYKVFQFEESNGE